MCSQNTYKPYLMRIEKITDEAPGVKSFRLKFSEDADREQFKFQAGQFGEYSVFGEGESTFCIASSPTRTDYIECTFRQTGRVTSALAQKEEGDVIGFRGPYGNIFPLEEWHGKNLLFIAGGIALPPLRSVIWNVLATRDESEAVRLADVDAGRRQSNQTVASALPPVVQIVSPSDGASVSSTEVAVQYGVRSASGDPPAMAGSTMAPARWMRPAQARASRLCSAQSPSANSISARNCLADWNWSDSNETSVCLN